MISNEKGARSDMNQEEIILKNEGSQKEERANEH